MEDVILEEGEGTIKTDTDSDIEEFAEDIKQKKKPVIDEKMKDKIQSRVEEIELEVFQKWCLDNYKDVFKDQLAKEDMIKCEQDLEIFVEQSDKVKPVNITTPAEIPVHLQKAAKGS